MDHIIVTNIAMIFILYNTINLMELLNIYHVSSTNVSLHITIVLVVRLPAFHSNRFLISALFLINMSSIG